MTFEDPQSVAINYATVHTPRVREKCKGIHVNSIVLIGAANSLQARFVDVLARWLLARETPGANPTLIGFVEL